jgi:mRNA interferase RelE/StbE
MYELFIERAVYKKLKIIPEKDYRKIIASINKLSVEPRPSGCKKLKGRKAYRIRQGNYRVIYEINDTGLTIIIVDVADRKDIY